MEEEKTMKNPVFNESIKIEDDRDQSDSENEKECELSTVELKNIIIENQELSNAVVIGSYNGENSDENLIIESDQQLVGTYIVRWVYLIRCNLRKLSALI